MILRNNLRSVDKKKDVSALICVMEFDHGIDTSKMTTDEKWLSENAKLTNTFISIDELKLFYHDKPREGHLTERQRWRVMGIVFEVMLFLVELFQLISQIISQAHPASIVFSVITLVVISFALFTITRNTIKDWGD